MTNLEQGFALEALRVEPLSGLVTGPGGREKLDPQVMDVLVLMADYVGQIVRRDDLLNRLWPNTVVTDDAVSRCICELRRHLERAGDEDRYRTLIETLPNHGYRLSAEVRPDVEPVPAPVVEPSNARRSLWIAIGIAVAAGLHFRE
jgi:DNA-binding winged helix-turn-helix (wHTH) protein